MSATFRSNSAASERTGAPRSEAGDDFGGDNVRVAVRVRPFNDTELRRGDATCVDVVNTNRVQLQSKSAKKAYTFNFCADESTDQSTMFDVCGIKNLLEAALDGFSATVFAYGQTGSGKTFSMAGRESNLCRDEYIRDDSDGLIPRSIFYLFEALANRHDKYTLRATFMEIYNEQVQDLLNPTSGTLKVRWNARQGFFVEDLIVVQCASMDDMIAVLNEGMKNRRVASHELNKDSSRSHSIMTVFVESEMIDPDDGHVFVKYGKVSFVDLAGSERLKESKSQGEMVKETGNINKSLFALGNVISCLAEKKTAHIPYRDSKLTKLLMDSLGGSSLCLMIACMSPSEAYAEETLSTLHFASRALRIKNRPIVQMDPKEQIIYNLRRELHLIRLENTYLREQLARASDGLPVLLPPSSAGSSSHLHHAPGSNFSPSSNINMPRNPVRSLSLPSKRLMSPASRAHAQLPPLSPLASPSSSVTSHYSRNAPPDPPSRQKSGQALALLSMSANQDTLSAAQEIMKEYHSELSRLKSENKLLRGGKEMAERQYKAVMKENETLQSKLDNLEAVFVGGGTFSRWHEDENRSPEESAAQVAAENARLRLAVRKLEHDNQGLQYRLQKHNEPSDEQQRMHRSNGLEQVDDGEFVELKQMNMNLQQQIEKLQKREHELISSLMEKQRLQKHSRGHVKK